MHGRKKADFQAPDEKKKAEIAGKIAKYRKLQEVLEKLRSQNDVSPKEVLPQLDLMLRMNSDYYSFWNFRKDVVAKVLSGIPDEGEGEAATKRAEFINGELKWSAGIIGERDPKSYPTWFYRKWFVREYDLNLPRLDAELTLCEKMLGASDERNFHCWGYRAWVVEQRLVLEPDTEGERARRELEYLNERVNVNFSNYSAWHRRASQALSGPEETAGRRWLGEWELLKDALYTDIGDQTAWIMAKHICEQGERYGLGAIAEEMQEACVTVLEWEGPEEAIDLGVLNNQHKWPLLALTWLKCTPTGRKKEILQALSTLDRSRAGFYGDALQKLGG